MDDNTKRQFREADAAIDRAVTAFMVKIESMPLKWDAVSRQYIVEGVLLKLCDEMTKLIDKPALANTMGPAMTKLSNARWPTTGIRKLWNARPRHPEGAAVGLIPAS